MKRKYSGFSLIEILIALVITGIIATIAIPAYMDSVNRANRTDAISDLNDTAQRLQRCFTTFGRYDQPNPPGGCAIYQQLIGPGLDTRKKFYNITLFNDGNPANDSFTFELRARAVTGGTQAKDKRCQILSINQAGVRAALDDGNAVSTDECWR
jgi:type IV pilus assembly protein PilE